MIRLSITLVVASLLFLIASLGLSAGLLLTGRSRLRRGRCGSSVELCDIQNSSCSLCQYKAPEADGEQL